MPEPKRKIPPEMMEILLHEELADARDDIARIMRNMNSHQETAALKFYLVGLLRGILRNDGLGELLWLAVGEFSEDLLPLLKDKGLIP